MHKIDIMLPFWGEPAYLYQTVEAVRGQDTDGWLLTVVDDCYPDPTVADYFEKLGDPRVRYIRNEKNYGITGNYERCVALATAELMIFLGCDDIPHPDFVRSVLALNRQFPSASIIQPGVKIIDENNRHIFPLADRVKALLRPSALKPRLLGGEPLAVSLLRADWMYWPSLVFRREILVQTPFRHGFPIIQDLAIVIDMVLEEHMLLIDPHVCFSYRRHSASASSTAIFDGRRFEGEREYFTLAVKVCEQKGWRRAARAARIHSTSRAHALTLIPSALRKKDIEGLRTVIKHAFSW
ncbi:glycosyltransferase family 2 protein [Schaalia suimastitidis]|uniref:glycosyltransferase family 2 protein n=1 Tax=Schaalia suimastitidis TaxID=121163 RepID=UPI000423E043|nr:glycosyltransferase family 2 protein [Schaalia suimastitidis]